MVGGRNRLMLECLIVFALPIALNGTTARAQILCEDLDNVSGTGSIDVLTGSGYNAVEGWDDDIIGEWAYVGTWGDGAITSAIAQGLPFGGVDGTGAGSLTVSGATYVEGGWFGGMFWPLPPLPTLDPSKLSIRADIDGSVFAGAYQLRIEANRFEPYGLDEDFEIVTGNGGGVILGPGGLEGWTPNFDDGIDGESAFSGVSPGGEVYGSVTVHGITSGGVGNSSAAEIIVDAISFGPGPGWWAGMAWADQILPSTDLTQIYLTADIKGTADPVLWETLGAYAVRLEDANQNWISFDMVSNGAFQTVGGALSDGVEGGFGGGVFDPTAAPFTVVVVMHNDGSDRWDYGGRLVLDNLFLSGGQLTKTVGSVSFPSIVSTNFRSVGGLLSNGVTTFVNVDQNFDTATGTGGADFFSPESGSESWTPGWDDGIEGEAAFAGFWGNVNFTGLVSAHATMTGGLDGGAAGELVASGLDVPNQAQGGWWAGLMWQEQTLPDGPLENIYLTAQIKGNVPDGKYHLRIEDADNDFLAFMGVSDGTFQSIGGSLSDATEGTFIGDGTFHRTHGPFTVVVGFFEEAATWGTGGALVVDDLFLTAPGFGAGADGFSAVVAFSDETDSWGTGGTLTVDNLCVLMLSSDVNDDGNTDLWDIARFQSCFTGQDGGIQEGCQLLDSDGDGDVDLADYEWFGKNINGPQ